MNRVALAFLLALASCEQPSPDMTTPLVGNGAFPAADTIQGPANFDPLSSANMRDLALQPLVNGLVGARQMLHGGGVKRRVKGVSSTSMIIQPLGGVQVTSGGNWVTLPHLTASTIDPTALAGGSLANLTRYYVYAYNNGGAVGFRVSTNAPEVGLNYDSTTTDNMFVSTFYTSSAGALLEYTQVDGEYRYFEYSINNRVLNAGNSTVAATVSLAGIIPAEAQIALLRPSWSSTTNTTATLRTSTPTNVFIQETSATGITSSAFVPYALVNGLQIDYLVGNANASLSIHVAGFTL